MIRRLFVSDAQILIPSTFKILILDTHTVLSVLRWRRQLSLSSNVRPRIQTLLVKVREEFTKVISGKGSFFLLFKTIHYVLAEENVKPDSDDYLERAFRDS